MNQPKIVAVPLSVRVDPEVLNQLAAIATATNRTKSFLAAEAIKHYVATQSWQLSAIQEAVKEADNPNAQWTEHQQVAKQIKQWSE